MKVTKSNVPAGGGGFLYAAALVMFFASAVRADVLITSDGESLSGSLTRVVDSILVFRTSLRGQMMIPTSEVRSLQTDGAWIVGLAGGDLHIGRFDRNAILIGSGGSATKQRVSIEYRNIVSAKKAPPVKETEDTAWVDRGEKGWKNEWSLGVESHLGTSDSIYPFMEWRGLGVVGEGQVGHRLRLGFDGAKGDVEAARLDVEFLFPKRGSQAPYLRAQADRDARDSLSLRTGLSVGLRHDFASGHNGEITGFFALSGYYSIWDGANGRPVFVGSDRERYGAVGPEAGLEYTRALPDAGNWESRLSLSPGSAPGSVLRAELESALSYPLSPRLFLRLDVLLAYENEPAFAYVQPFGANLGASIGVEF